MVDYEFRKQLTKLMIPIAFQQFMTALVSASDAFMLGFMSQNAMSAVSLAGQVMFIYSLFLYGITMGTSIFSAQYYGKGDMHSVGKYLLSLLTFRQQYLSFLHSLPYVYRRD